MKSGYPLNAKHAELKRRSVHQLRLKAVEMLRSSTQLVKSFGDELGLGYLWNGDEYGSLENSLKAMDKNAEYGGQLDILALVHVIERPITVHCEDSDKGTYLEKFFKKNHYVLLRRATLLSQPENGKVYSLGDYVAVRSETNDWLMCVVSE